MKHALRKEIKTRFKRMEEILPPAALHLPENTKTLFIYFPLESEIDVLPLAEIALKSGATVAAPRVVGDNLHFHRVTSLAHGLVEGAYGIREPAPSSERVFPTDDSASTAATATTALQFPVQILVPGLAFDRTGQRLGRGAGFYDRFLSAFLSSYRDRRDDITLIGVCHEFQIVNLVPTDVHDIPVDCLLTEKGCIFCTK